MLSGGSVEWWLESGDSRRLDGEGLSETRVQLFKGCSVFTRGWRSESEEID